MEDLGDLGDIRETLAEARNTVTRIEGMRAKDFPDSLDIELVEDLWHMFFSTAIATCVETYRQVLPDVPKEAATTISRILDKWDLPDDDTVTVDSAMFDDFRADMKNLSQNCDYWGAGSLSIEGFFEAAIWNQYFLPLREEVGELAARMQRLLSKRADHKQALDNFAFEQISPYQFEEVVADLYRRMGYEAETTPSAGDFGIDVIAKKSSVTVAIQAKRFSKGNNVGNRDVQRLLGAMQYHKFKADRAVLVTTSDFTPQARKQAIGASIELWDGCYLGRMLQRYPRRGDIVPRCTRFACPHCNVRIKAKQNTFGKKTLCPKCKGVIRVPTTSMD